MPDGLWQVVQGYAIHFPGTVAVAVPGQLSTTVTHWPISMQCLADDLIGLGIKSFASPINVSSSDTYGKHRFLTFGINV